MKYFLPLFLLTLFLGCDGPYNDCPQYRFSDNYKSYTFFNEGSWWVYKDTVYHQTDSMSLIAQSVEFIDYCDYNTQSEEVLEQQFSSTFFAVNNKIHGHASFGEYNTDGNVPVGIFMDRGVVAQPPEFLDSLKVNGVWYQSIYVFKSGSHEYYWAKDIGLVKKVLPYPATSDTVYHFDLVRYQLK